MLTNVHTQLERYTIAVIFYIFGSRCNNSIGVLDKCMKQIYKKNRKKC